MLISKHLSIVLKKNLICFEWDKDVRKPQIQRCCYSFIKSWPVHCFPKLPISCNLPFFLFFFSTSTSMLNSRFLLLGKMNICLNLHFIFICSPIKRRCSLYLCMLRPLIFPLPWLPCRRPHRAWRCQGQVPGCAGQDESEAVGAAWRNGSRQQPSLWPCGWPQELWRCLEPRVVLTALWPLSITSAWNYSSISTYSLCIYPQSILLKLFINFYLFSVYLSPINPTETIHQFLLFLGVFIPRRSCWNCSSISTYSLCINPQSILCHLWTSMPLDVFLGIFAHHLKRRKGLNCPKSSNKVSTNQ